MCASYSLRSPHDARFKSKFFFSETATEETTFQKPGGPVGFSLKEQHTYDGNTKVSVTSRRRRRTMRFCFHLANVILPLICIMFVVIFFMTGYITSAVNANK